MGSESLSSTSTKTRIEPILLSSSSLISLLCLRKEVRELEGEIGRVKKKRINNVTVDKYVKLSKPSDFLDQI